MNDEQRAVVQEYLKDLKPGERVVETGDSMLKGREGTVYISESELTKGSICVMWDTAEGKTGTMGTSATWGTRRIEDTH